MTGDQLDPAALLAEFGPEALSDSVVPTRCPEGCEVEPDGECPHGHPSVLVAAGLI
jgi:hypothetical protein